ncbi:Gfo/Idh/MocA family protein [Paenibacillus medicaginis]|uniref:Gfo/Idh/MocA family protein n=1 Tax=Paenibacillus medicaginis TaxID=1470560 RepID=A0ABV5C8S8_9BACL
MNIGIAGSGMIVRFCLDALQEIDSIECTAICVREQGIEKGEELAKTYGIGKIYTDYGAMLQNGDIDFIYIGIVNSLHYEYAKKALEAGKHVIVEKPFTSTFQEALTLEKLAREKNLFLFEAITLLYSPNYQFIKEQLPLIGDIKLIQSNFSKVSSRYSEYATGTVLPAFDPYYSGGALYDLNIYNLHFVAGLLGMPQEVRYVANIGHNGIDTSGIVTLRYDQSLAVCCGSKDSDSDGFITIQGEKGLIRLDSPPNLADSVIVNIGQDKRACNFNKAQNHMVNEFVAFAEMFRSGDYDQCYKNLRHSVSVIDIACQARRDAGIHFAADE